MTRGLTGLLVALLLAALVGCGGGLELGAGSGSDTTPVAGPGAVSWSSAGW